MAQVARFDSSITSNKRPSLTLILSGCPTVSGACVVMVTMCFFHLPRLQTPSTLSQACVP